MEYIVYKFPPIKGYSKEKLFEIAYDTTKAPKLIKYGFNQIADSLDLLSLTTDDHYRAGLNFDFERSDAKGVKNIGSKSFDKTFDMTFAEFWEIFITFDLLSTEQSIQTSHPDIITNLINAYNKLVKKTKSSVSNSKKNNTLVIYKFSDVELDENVLVQLLLSKLSELMQYQIKGSSMILQLYSLQTEIMIEIIHFLVLSYTDVYLYRPNITSNLSNNCYIICTNLNQIIDLPKMKFTDDTNIVKLFSNSIKTDQQITTIIQCYNSETVPENIIIYNKIKKYLDSKVYEGLTYQEMIDKQNENTDKWISKYVTNIDKLSKLLTEALNKTSDKCNYVDKLNNLFN